MKEDTTEQLPAVEEAERERRLLWLLQRIHTYTIKTKSDLARDNADEIAEAASRGFISTRVIPGQLWFGRVWKITTEGLTLLSHRGHLIAESEIANFKESPEQ